MRASTGDYSCSSRCFSYLAKSHQHLNALIVCLCVVTTEAQGETSSNVLGVHTHDSQKATPGPEEFSLCHGFSPSGTA